MARLNEESLYVKVKGGQFHFRMRFNARRAFYVAKKANISNCRMKDKSVIYYAIQTTSMNLKKKDPSKALNKKRKIK